ncbi:UPF0182 family protein [Streptomyces sp. ST2-7A]|uniref:UPF0182 family protein n=1 Tax=Streptomyces sp. ST2-7A TaxID=2907214 RepID=UPI001F210A13|nr:UPF0182 family protein [Streptomyces sp. ST2-7A]MCE7082517.1 UPF0182 family protein [Streptomyces sp. ST2-7A]
MPDRGSGRPNGPQGPRGPRGGGPGGPGVPGFALGRPSGGAKTLLITAAVLAGLVILFAMFAGFWTDWKWYQSVDFTTVFTTQLVTRIVMFAVFGLIMALAVGLNIWLAHRLRPPLSAMSMEQQNLDRYRMSIAPYKKWVLIAASLLIGLIAGGSASGQWRTWLQWVNGTPFGVTDAQFGMDISFFAFDYPFYRFLIGFGFAVVVLSLLAAGATHYLYGGLRVTTPGNRITPAATGHLSVLMGLFVALKAVAYWFDRYGLALKSSDFRDADGWTGLRYVDANAYLPARTILTIIAIICAVLFFATLWRRTWQLPVIGLGLLVLSAVLIGSVYPALVQQFQVRPNEQAMETPYIQKHLEATKEAYGIDAAEKQAFGRQQAGLVTDENREELRDSVRTTASIRLVDPNVISPAFQQLQQIRGYYSFADTLDVDRYPTASGEQDTVIGVREINIDGLPDRNWINDHFRYTHGFGVVAARGDDILGNGTPDFIEKELPPEGELGEYEPRIYFGEATTHWSIVGGPQPELDYIRGDAGEDETEAPEVPEDGALEDGLDEGTEDTGGTDGAEDGTDTDTPGGDTEAPAEDMPEPGQEVDYSYTGEGGVELGNYFNRAAYALALGEPQILYSGAIGEGSQIMYRRTPTERVEAVAPWLTIDADPYPAVVDGRVQWIVDAYTTSNGYPYSSRTVLDQATATALTDAQRQVLAQQNQINYMRNSVKATVDAYSGEVVLYEWEEGEPVLETWMKAFPDTVTPREEISDELMAHLRYPQDLFNVQRDLLQRYHVDSASLFYAGGERWEVPDDPTQPGNSVPSYYLSMRMPDQDARTFSLTTTFNPRDRETLAAYMAVVADARSDDYGTMRVLTLPNNTTTPGPQQVQSRWNAEPDIAESINLLQRGDSEVEYGNLLTVPLGDDLLYVEPVYVLGAGANYPRMQRVLASYGDELAFEASLDAALDTLFGVAETGEEPEDTPPAEEGEEPEDTPDVTADLADWIGEALEAQEEADTALSEGDWAAYGEAQDKLAEALRRIAEVEEAARTEDTGDDTDEDAAEEESEE